MPGRSLHVERIVLKNELWFKVGGWITAVPAAGAARAPTTGRRCSLKDAQPSTHLVAAEAGVHGHAVVVAVVLVQRPLDRGPGLGGGAAALLQRGSWPRPAGRRAATTRATSPQSSAVAASTCRPVRSMSRARAGTDLAGQDLGVVGVGDAPQQLGRPERRPLAGHRHVGQHGDHQPAALADAVDRRTRPA